MNTPRKVLVTLSFDPKIIANFSQIMDRLTQKGFHVVVDPRYRLLSSDELIKAIDGSYAHIVTSELMTPDIMDSNKSLKVISRMGIGFDTVDVPGATARGIAVTITPGANAEPVAEFTVALMLALTRKILEIDQKGREGVWRTHFGISMWRKTLGLIGLGNIGKLVAKLVSGFDMKILAYDPVQDPEYARKNGITYCPLDEILRESDFLSVHVPLNDQTSNLISEKELNSMKPTAQIVNCARGGIINEKALFEALKSKRIAGAALDVFDDEPFKLDDPLLTLDNVLISTHTAGMTYEGRGKVIEMAVQNVIDISEGKIPKGTVNPAVLK